MTKVPNPPPPQKPMESRTSRRREPEIVESDHEDDYPTDLEGQPCIPIIFVMGVSGAGKSSFINTLGGKDSRMESPVISAAESATHEVGVYKVVLDGQEMLLVDTPGFEDNKMSNLETLQKICEYIVEVTNNAVCIIRGAVYVYNLATSRWAAGDQRTWTILEALCGDGAMGNVVVATTRWPADHEEEDYEQLEKTNLEKYWEGVLGTVRLAKNDVQNSRAAIRMLLGVHPKTFQVQWELSHGNTPSDTSAGRIAITEGEEALSKAEKEKEYALAELMLVASQFEPVQPHNAPKLTPPPPRPPPPPETKAQDAANFKKEMEALQQRIESVIHASYSQLERIKSSENNLQGELQKVQAAIKEKEKLLKEYHRIRRTIESPRASKLKKCINYMRNPIPTRKRNLLATLLVAGTLMVDIGQMSFPFYGFAALGAVLLYKGVETMSKNANRTPKKNSQASQKATQTSGMEGQIPTINMEEGVGLNDGGDGDDERVERRRARTRMKAQKMKSTDVKGGAPPQKPPPPPTVQRRSSWFSFWWT